MQDTSIGRDRIAATERLIRPYIRHTPVITIDAADFGLAPRRLALKLEFLQHTGSFKPRGAFTNLLTREVPAAGVVAASGGNHGAAVAFVAMRLGIQATIFVPKVASPAKLDRIRSYGAELVVTGEVYAEALAASEKLIAKTGALPVHAYDQPETLLGQGSVGLELEADRPDIDTLLVATGGGGLVGGIAAWYAGKTRVRVGRAGSRADPARRAEGRSPGRCAGGRDCRRLLAPRQVGQLMFPIAQRYVAEAVLVTDEAIVDAQRRLWDVLRIAAEPGGATALAALLSGRYKPAKDEHLAVLLCGANTTAVEFGR